MLIAQLSDIHVRPRGQLYKGVIDSNRMLQNAIEHLHTFDRRPDFVWVTGDLVDEGMPEEYSMAVELLKTLSIPFAVMAGNHDHRDNLRDAFSSHRYLPETNRFGNGALHYCIDDFAVRLIALDSTIAGVHHGHVDDEGLAWLDATLRAAPTKPTLVALHHPPFVSGISYMDEYGYPRSDDLAAVLSKFNNIEAVLCGHVHRSMMRRWAGTIVSACPSTTSEIALQLGPHPKPQSYLGPAACMLHLWDPDNGLVSHLSYIGKYPGPFPFF